MSKDNDNFEETQKDKNEESNSFYPWIKKNSKCHSLKGMLKLHYEILDFYDFIKLNKEEIKSRNKTLKEISNIIEDNFTNYQCKLYGSFLYELSLPNSDIDILIIEKNHQKEISAKKDENTIYKNLENIFNVLNNQNIFENLEIIHAKVPIITGLYKETKIHVDISLYKKNEIQSAEIIKKLISVYPEIKPLMLLIKYIIRQRNLNQIYTGGVSSFILFTLLYYYISDTRKQIEYEVEKGEKEKVLTLGHLLIGFFNFYAFEFNYERFGISILNGCYLYERTDDKKNKLSVKNFEDENQDLGISCFNYGKILDVFKFCAERLNYANKNVVSYLKEFIFQDDTLKERSAKKI